VIRLKTNYFINEHLVVTTKLSRFVTTYLTSMQYEKALFIGFTVATQYNCTNSKNKIRRVIENEANSRYRGENSFIQNPNKRI
jgi:regulatory protein YycH of two-component signal transduction system YycFG